MKRLFFLCALAAAIALTSCQLTPNAKYDPLVIFTLDTSVHILMPYRPQYGLAPGPDGRLAAFVYDNCMFQVGENVAYLYQRRQGAAVSLKSDSVFLYVNDKPHSITVTKENLGAFSHWLENAGEKEMKNLAIVMNSMEDSGPLEASLERLVAVNPRVTLIGLCHSPVFAKTRPEYLLLDEMCDSLIEMPDLSGVVTIDFNEDYGIQLSLLGGARLPALKNLSLICSEQEEAEAIIREFPNLEVLSLSFIEGNLPDLAAFQKLRTLLLCHFDTTDLAPIASLQNLEDLYLMGDFEIMRGLDLIRNLKRLSVEGASQEDVDLLASNNPGLVFLDITSTGVENLDFLTGTPELEGISLPREDVDLAPLSGLPKLRYLSIFIEEDTLSEAETHRIEELKTICPRCLIYYTQGVCLGSGWLLLLLPALAVFLWVKKRGYA